MIYPVVVKKISSGRYFAFCVTITSVWAIGETIGDVISKIQREFSWRLHDRDAQIDVIVINDEKSNTQIVDQQL